MTLKGDVKLDAAAPQPVTVTGDGTFRVKEEQAGKVRLYVATAEKRTYSVDGKEQPLDAAAEAWLREVVRGLTKNRPEGGPRRVVEVQRKRLEGAPGEGDHPTPEGRRLRVEVQKAEGGEGPATVIIHREGPGGEQVEKHLRIVTEDRESEGCGECGPLEHPGKGRPGMGRPGMGHPGMMGQHAGLLPPDREVLQAEVAALQAQLKVLQARLNQLQKAIQATPKASKGGAPVPPPPAH